MELLNTKIARVLIIAILMLYCKISPAQLPVITIPQAATMGTNGFQPNNGVQNINAQQYQQQEQLKTQQQNEQLIQEAETYQNQQKGNKRSYSPDENNAVTYSLPSFSDNPETESYQLAFTSLNNMLAGKEPLSLKKAVFEVENAYFNNSLNYQSFEKQIQECVKFSKLALTQHGYKDNDPWAANWILYQFMADTLALKINEKTIAHAPLKYDFDDFDGQNDWSKMFVTKLLTTKTGQCHSLPLLYLILCNELGTKAYLSYSPRHSFVKIKDNRGNMYNLELTNGHIVSDAFITGSGFLKADALKNKIYMDTLGLRKQIASCMVDLAQGYCHKFGYDAFMLKCANTALKYNPANIDALQVKANYYTILNHHIARQLPQIKTREDLDKYPKAKEILMLRNQMYEAVDKSGYQEMPAEAYQNWLQSVNTEKYKQEHTKKTIFIQSTLK
jgi:hypothetical protein